MEKALIFFKNQKKILCIILIVALFLNIDLTQCLSAQTAKIKKADLFDVESIDLIKIKNLFDKLNNEVNNGNGYKDYLNNDGFPTGALIAWSESKLMESYINMYEATEDMKYIDSLYNHIISVLSNRDDKLKKLNYKNELVPVWGTDRYSKDGSYKDFLVHSGLITYPMLEFVKIVKNENIQKYQKQADEILNDAVKTIDYYNANWVNKDDYGYYVEDGEIKPLNMQSAMGKSLLSLYNITGKQDYLLKVNRLANLLKDSIAANGGNCWGYFNGKIGKNNPPEDISHAGITTSFIYLLYKNDILFNERDISNIANRLNELNDNGIIYDYVNKTGDNRYEISYANFILYAKYNKDIKNKVTDLLFKDYRVQQTAKYIQEDWWGTIMLSISKYALFLANN